MNDALDHVDHFVEEYAARGIALDGFQIDACKAVARNRDEALAFVVPEGRRRKARFSSDLAYAHPFHGRELTS